MKRRDFLKSGAVGAGATVTLAGCGGPEEKLIPLLIPEEQILPGVDKWTASTCALCAAGCGITVRSMMGEAKIIHEGQERRRAVLQVKKIEGNPRHPINLGKLCARGQAGPQVLYNPDRVQKPLKRSGPRGSGQYQDISWDEALRLLEDKVTPLRSAGTGNRLAAIVGETSPRRAILMREFLEALGSSHCYAEAPHGISVLREANRRIFGRPEIEVHDLENANYLISFGADIVETHTSPVRYNLALGHFRQGRPGVRGKFVQVEGRFSLTAANADEWLPARLGTEAYLALAMAHVLVKEELFDREFARSVRGFDRFREWLLEGYSPEKISAFADVPAEKIVRVAREFAAHQPGLALAGGAAIAGTNGLFAAAAVQSLNALVGNIGRKGGIGWTASSDSSRKRLEHASDFWVDDFIRAVQELEVLFLWDADPLYSNPTGMGLREALSRIPTIVGFGCFVNESLAQADLILPERTFLERWDLNEPVLTAGTRTISITQPVVKPLYEARDGADVLLQLANQWGGKVREALPDADFPSYLKRKLGGESVLRQGSFSSDDMDSFWSMLQENGVWIDSASQNEKTGVDLSYLWQSPASDSFAVPVPGSEYLFLPYPSTALGDGRLANVPWLQELPDPMTSIVWGSWIEMNPKTAASLGIEEGELILLESSAGKLKAPVVFSVAARPDTVCMPFGQGHTKYGRYASGRGANPWQIILPARIHEIAEPAWAATRVRITKTGEKAAPVRIGYDREHTPTELAR